jgi:hypothetical protein
VQLQQGWHIDVSNIRIVHSRGGVLIITPGVISHEVFSQTKQLAALLVGKGSLSLTALACHYGLNITLLFFVK